MYASGQKCLRFSNRFQFFHHLRRPCELTYLVIYQQSDHGDSLDRNFRRLFLDKNITWSSREDNPTCNITPQWGQIHSDIAILTLNHHLQMALQCT